MRVFLDIRIRDHSAREGFYRFEKRHRRRYIVYRELRLHGDLFFKTILEYYFKFIRGRGRAVQIHPVREIVYPFTVYVVTIRQVIGIFIQSNQTTSSLNSYPRCFFRSVVHT